jgi:ribosomal protein L18
MDDANRTYAWTVEGEVVSGTLEKYARNWENAYCTGLEVGNRVWTGAHTKPVAITSDGRADDYLFYTIRVGNETVTARIDGRA